MGVLVEGLEVVWGHDEILPRGQVDDEDEGRGAAADDLE